MDHYDYNHDFKFVAVQDDLEELYAGNNNDAKMKTKNVNNAGILVSSM